MENRNTAGAQGEDPSPALCPGPSRGAALAALVVTALCYLLWTFSGTLYMYLDNMTISMVASGMFGAGFFCQYIHPLLSLLIRGLSALLPTADVFASLVHAGLLGGVFTVTYIGFRLLGGKSLRSRSLTDWLALLALLLAVLFFTLGLKLWSVNYTVQTAALLAAGLIALSYAADSGEGRGWIAAGSALIGAGWLLRLETDLLFIPFIGLELLTGLLNARDKKEALRRQLRYFGPALLIAALLLGSKALFNAREPYVSDNAYTRYRTIVEDYPMEPYERSGAAAAGIDEQTYRLVAGNWVLLDTERIDAALLRRMAETGSRRAFSCDQAGLRGALREMARRLRGTDVYLTVLAALIALLTLRNCLAARSRWLKAEALLAFLGGFVILLYFTFRGRALFRLWQTVLLAQAAVLLCNSLRVARETRPETEKPAVRRTRQALALLVLCVPLYYAAGQMIAHAAFHGPISPLSSRLNADDSAYAETWQGDGLYIWSNWYMTIPVHFADQNKLPTQRVLDHNISVGDWIYGQVYFRDYLEARDAANPAAALIERPETYLMGGFVNDLLPYLQQFYGETLHLSEAGEIKGVTAYRLER